MSEPNKSSCACGAAPKLIFSCSGAADVGEVADRVARRLTKNGVGKMYCLAGIGGRVNSILVNAQAASRILAIDGCALDCARNTLEQAGFDNIAHLRLTDLGMQKGASPATDERVDAVAEKAKTLLEC